MIETLSCKINKSLFLFAVMKDIQVNTDPTLSRKEFYSELLEQVQCICEDQTFWVKFFFFQISKFFIINKHVMQVTNLSNASTVIYHGLISLEHFQEKPINWCGFYITNPKNPQQLILGPFQGKVKKVLKRIILFGSLIRVIQVACTVIPFGKGVCGTAASSKEPQLVRDVHEFPGHIACDSASNSEVVIPLVKDGVKSLFLTLFFLRGIFFF